MLTTKASLRIIGDLDPDEITRELTIAPSYTHRKGEPDRCGETRQEHIWVLKSVLGKNEDLERHIQSLFDQLRGKKQILERLSSTCTIDVFCSITSTDPEGFSLTPKVLSTFSDFDIVLEVSIIAFSGEE